MVTRPPKRKFFVLFMGFWLPVVAYVTLIFAVSAQPNLQAPLTFLNGDKILHAGEYLVLGLLLVRAMRASLRVSRPLFAAIITIALVLLVGASDEYLQSFIPGRQSDLFDLFADLTGGAIAQFVYVTFVRS
jgi:VanZ family protein